MSEDIKSKEALYKFIDDQLEVIESDPEFAQTLVSLSEAITDKLTDYINFYRKTYYIRGFMDGQAVAAQK